MLATFQLQRKEGGVGSEPEHFMNIKKGVIFTSMLLYCR